MKFGYLGGANLLAGQEVSPYRVDAPAVAASYTASFCNRGVTPAVVQLAVGTGADSAAPGTIFFEFNAKVMPGIPLERSGLGISQGMKVFVKSDADLVDVALCGYEKG